VTHAEVGCQIRSAVPTLDDSTAITIDIFADSWQWGRKESFKTSGWKTDASVQHLCKFNHFLINLVTFPWILEMGSFWESTNGTIRWKCRQGARYTVLPNPYFVFASD